MKKVHNFSAGPGILPELVIKQAAAAVLNFDNLNMSILEISHRSKNYVTVMDNARQVVKDLLLLDDNYEVFFLGGGASLQFAMVPYNLLGTKAAYINTGVWSTKAIKEAKIIGNVEVIASSEDKNFSYIPKNYTIPTDADYLHITSNNTIFGTQFKEFPKSPIPLVCDMSSDIFSRPIDGKQFALIYAGAQKNMGPAGCTMVAVRKDVLGKTERKMLSMLDYAVHIKAESMYNTPPVYPVYVSMLTMQYVQANGGLELMEKLNNAKAQLLYNEIDRNGLFTGTVAKEDRSVMNVNFIMNNSTNEDAFNKIWKDAGVSGLPGHRDVGGYRASIYNAMPIDSVQVLVDVMKLAEQKLG
ncbi:MAG: 3-phosphoserine/phosphohydroxythreonine transaminase [Bacteroidia bacterium]|nr:3-phosphoserine/phosphohydroxythreonine transaminase [Bacteroidia bacterium]